jgi:hypothetical protein
MAAFRTHFKLTPLYIALSLTLSSAAIAADFTIVDGQTETTTQTLTADGDTGTIDAGGAVNTGAGATAVNSPAPNITVINNGSISSIGAGSGVTLDGANSTLINNGSISSTGDNGVGFLSGGDNVMITNSGSISTVGNNSYGIFSNNDTPTITNSGSISVTGDNGVGTHTSGDNSSITNSGSISVTGDNGIVIFADGVTNSTITNSGSISITGINGVGILVAASNSTITNSGLISAPAGNAILGAGASGVTLNVLPGSQIIGAIDLGGSGDGDTANVYSGGVSSSLTFLNTENINLFGAGAVVGNTVITVDATGESTRGVALAIMSSSIHRNIDARMNLSDSLVPVEVASLELSPGMYFKERKPLAWADFYGGSFDRNAEGSALAYDHDHAGVNFGYDWNINQNRIGLMGGVVESDTETQSSSFRSEATHYYVGAYGNRKVNGLSITASMLAGYGENDNERLVIDNVGGRQVAKSDFNSYFISPALNVASAYTVSDRFEFRPSANIIYSVEWLDDYTETGIDSSNLAVDGRQARALTAKAQLAAAYAFSEKSELEFRVGVNTRHTDDDDTAVSIAGNQFTFANAGDESVEGGFVGANLRLLSSNNLTLVADVEVGGDRKEDYVNGYLTVEYVF